MIDRTQNCGQPITAKWEGEPMYTGEAGCYMHAVNDLYIGDSWFGSVKACKKLALRGKDCILCVKQANKGFPKDLIELTMSGWPGGTSLVMKTVRDISKV